MAESETKLGPRIAALTQERGLDVTDLSRASGLKEGTLYKLLRGDQDSTSFEAGLRISAALGIDPWDLAGIARRPDFIIELPDGSRIVLEVKLERGSTDLNLTEERIASGLSSALSSVFPEAQVIRSRNAVKIASPLVLDEAGSLPPAVEQRIAELVEQRVRDLLVRAEAIESQLDAQSEQKPGQAARKGAGSA